MKITILGLMFCTFANAALLSISPRNDYIDSEPMRSIYDNRRRQSDYGDIDKAGAKNLEAEEVYGSSLGDLGDDSIVINKYTLADRSDLNDEAVVHADLSDLNDEPVVHEDDKDSADYDFKTVQNAESADESNSTPVRFEANRASEYDAISTKYGEPIFDENTNEASRGAPNTTPDQTGDSYPVDNDARGPDKADGEVLRRRRRSAEEAEGEERSDGEEESRDVELIKRYVDLQADEIKRLKSSLESLIDDGNVEGVDLVELSDLDAAMRDEQELEKIKAQIAGGEDDGYDDETFENGEKKRDISSDSSYGRLTDEMDARNYDYGDDYASDVNYADNDAVVDANDAPNVEAYFYPVGASDDGLYESVFAPRRKLRGVASEIYSRKKYRATDDRGYRRSDGGYSGNNDGGYSGNNDGGYSARRENGPVGYEANKDKNKFDAKKKLNVFLRKLAVMKTKRFTKVKKNTCSALTHLKRNCSEAAENGLSLDEQAEDICLRHQICMICASAFDLTRGWCHGMFAYATEAVCGDDAMCSQQAGRLYSVLNEVPPPRYPTSGRGNNPPSACRRKCVYTYATELGMPMGLL